MSLKAVEPLEENEVVPNGTTETIFLPEEHVEYLERMSQELNPAMANAFGWSHAIRTILDRFEQSGIDLTAASSEEEIALLAAAKLRDDSRANARLCASVSSRSAVRQEYQSNLPATGRCRSGRPPR